VTTPHERDTGAGVTVGTDVSRRRNFWLRVASATVLTPIAIACAYIGGWPFLLACAMAACAILWEWTALTAGGASRVLVPGLAALWAATGLVGGADDRAAIGAIFVGAILAGGIVTSRPRGFPSSKASDFTTAAWAAGGVIYAGIALLGPALLRGDPEWGFAAILFLFATVWATDIFAYGFGRAIGGPLLWPSVSPNKTWAGAIGGTAGGVAAGIAVAYASGVTRLGVAGILALILSIVAQGGDLFESAVKRRFGAKDAGGLIPGHGGVMDRLDGFLVAALAAVAIGIARQGLAAPARGLLAW
jgi:phosphatidate cytidylyltransferase